jgi:hypothetical protein
VLNIGFPNLVHSIQKAIMGLMFEKSDILFHKNNKLENMLLLDLFKYYISKYAAKAVSTNNDIKMKVM